eukprot:345020_1
MAVNNQKHILFILVVVMVLSVHTQSDRKYCDEEVHCDGHGICIVDEDLDLNRCHCDEGYITTGGEYAEIQCDYKQKDQLTAFLLHFFLGQFGAGRFYVGDIGYGVDQLLYSVLTFLFGICIPPVLACCCGVEIWW